EGKNVASYEQYKTLMPSFSLGKPFTHPVGKFPPSPLGLYDMGFNGWDWMDDWFDPDYYAHSPRKSPRGPATGTAKVQRGIDGGAADTAITMYRQKSTPIYQPFIGHDGIVKSNLNTKAGFRCAANEPRPIGS
ncbi:MAG TPA: SUMF1/EgtB/PvdO family nonheme iron enzyme, partial [Rhizobacter sp.]|nr:SUMF1/EgtB/PvdO family nonheme iron enzyme [Rhizobacter sp.]